MNPSPFSPERYVTLILALGGRVKNSLMEVPTIVVSRYLEFGLTIIFPVTVLKKILDI